MLSRELSWCSPAAQRSRSEVGQGEEVMAPVGRGGSSAGGVQERLCVGRAVGEHGKDCVVPT